ncbi:hypothetical protein BGW36DRAFT_2206 [Talaromyces proteolyticus]|uniref:Uncharacterized protein n=1 Tax=Talaromyces proteolyticus TaxID=1131652 RepID=A0AAD4L1E1_9EURO|nr:uncharacterized protein BGW36DRAFT_2206 [Talaromyces proteolyticus]KAH8704820.1 hypothetical protein BGW36DRAFT_2206 [Talaromyces proteolyticus]
MCIVTLHETHTCAHRWVTLHTACHQIKLLNDDDNTTQNENNNDNIPPKAGFNTCPHLNDTDDKLRTRYVVEYIIGSDDECPRCVKRGQYDRNECRVIRDTEYRLGFGMGRVDRKRGDVGVPCVLL